MPVPVAAEVPDEEPSRKRRRVGSRPPRESAASHERRLVDTQMSYYFARRAAEERAGVRITIEIVGTGRDTREVVHGGGHGHGVPREEFYRRWSSAPVVGELVHHSVDSRAAFWGLDHGGASTGLVLDLAEGRARWAASRMPTGRI